MSDAATAGDGAIPPARDDPLERLLQLQDLDTAMTQVQHRRAALPERAELESVEEALAALSVRAEGLGEQDQALTARQAELEKQIASAASRRQALEDRMYAARGSAARDLQAMEGEVRHLVERRAELEEAELEVMIEREPVDAALAEVAEERAKLEESATSLREVVGAAEAGLDQELAVLEAERGPARAGLPEDLLERYEGLRRRLGGVGAARLVGNRCDGCHLELPSAEVDRIRHLPPGTAATCDQCGRILVRVSAPG
ncbi:MAG TPA: C4-type zinc ribbon domain-containing protein [Acidimicrobiales bacterium]|nr:C4-type zinc ribbon domain-containing protein [Acidimicrobiales bacterium]